MRKRTTAIILSGALATGAAAAVAITPASAATTGNTVTSRLATIKSALSGLVKDGTLTQAQADKVATTLDTTLPQRGDGDHGPGGRGGHFGGPGMQATQDAAAKALGMTTTELRTALQGGKSLADVAKTQKVSVDALVKAMVTAAEQQLATAVKDGKLTQTQADAMKADLTQRITDRVNDVHQGRGGRGPGHDDDAPATGTSTPSVSPSSAA